MVCRTSSRLGNGCNRCIWCADGSEEWYCSCSCNIWEGYKTAIGFCVRKCRNQLDHDEFSIQFGAERLHFAVHCSCFRYLSEPNSERSILVVRYSFSKSGNRLNRPKLWSFNCLERRTANRSYNIWRTDSVENDHSLWLYCTALSNDSWRSIHNSKRNHFFSIHSYWL